MLRSFLVFILTITSNIAAFYVADRVLPGFTIAPGILGLVVAALLFALLHTILRPALKLLLGPLILLTLGLALVLVHMALLYILTLFTESITIDGTVTLLYATIVIGAVNSLLNFLIHRVARPR